MTDYHYLLVFGEICSGKGTYCQQWTRYGYKHIVVSDIVKRLSKQTERSELCKTGHLANEILMELVTITSNYNKVVIDGIRQFEIAEQLLSWLPPMHTAMILLNPAEEIRRSRFNERGDRKDNLSFDELTALDNALGMKELKERFRELLDLQVKLRSAVNANIKIKYNLE